MRSVVRNQIPPPTVLTSTEGKGKKETLKAISFYQDRIAQPTQPVGKKKKVRQFEFKAYKDAAVKAALESLFHGKCAYCESRYAAIQPVDIEHWRPKKEVLIGEDGSTKRHGYYCLADREDG